MGGISIGTLERRGRHQRSNYTILCVISFAFCFVSPGGSVPKLKKIVSYYINRNSKLTYMLPLPFDFRVAHTP